MKAIVTGAAGFVGRHLIDLLDSCGDTTVAIARPGQPIGNGEWRSVELLDPAAVHDLIAAERPDAIYHLAGQASVALSWRDPAATFRDNVEPLLNLCAAIVDLRLDPAILVVGSNEMYGNAPTIPTNEDAPLQPSNPYASSKVAQEAAAAQYHLSHRLRTARVRPFNHIGPGQRPDFALPSFARQIAAIERGLRPPVIQVGNLDARRDLTDARDVVRAYRLAIQSPGAVFNIGSGEPILLRSALDRLLELSQVPIKIETDPARLRPADVPLTACDASRLRNRTGWEPVIPLDSTFADILADWRSRPDRDLDD